MAMLTLPRNFLHDFPHEFPVFFGWVNLFIRSGLLKIVFLIASFLRHFLISSWFPERSTEGTSMSIELIGPCILRIFKQARAEALIKARLFIAKHPGNTSGDRIDED